MMPNGNGQAEDHVDIGALDIFKTLAAGGDPWKRTGGEPWKLAGALVQAAVEAGRETQTGELPRTVVVPRDCVGRVQSFLGRVIPAVAPGVEFYYTPDLGDEDRVVYQFRNFGEAGS